MNFHRCIRMTAASALAIGVVVLSGSTFAGTEAAGTITIRNYAGPCFWANADWGDLNPAERAAWSILGWTWAKWDSETESAPASAEKDWDELSVDERAAARMLGFDARLWDNFDSDSCVGGDDD